MTCAREKIGSHTRAMVKLSDDGKIVEAAHPDDSTEMSDHWLVEERPADGFAVL